jgi:hypothetical protein
MPLNDHTSPREQLRYDLKERFREAMRGLVERVDTEAMVTSEVDPDGQGKHLWSGVPVLTMVALNTAMHTFDEPLPAPSELTAELRTPGTLFVAAECPECHLPQQIPMVIDVKLEVEGSIRTLHLKGKSKAAVHRCGQLPLPERKNEDQAGLPWNETEEEPAETTSMIDEGPIPDDEADELAIDPEEPAEATLGTLAYDMPDAPPPPVATIEPVDAEAARDRVREKRAARIASHIICPRCSRPVPPNTVHETEADCEAAADLLPF